MSEFNPHDEHYRTKEIEPILFCEQIMKTALVIPTEARYSVAQCARYLGRVVTKEGEDWRKELEKAENYLRRARTGEWIKKEKIESIDVSNPILSLDELVVKMKEVEDSIRKKHMQPTPIIPFKFATASSNNPVTSELL